MAAPHRDIFGIKMYILILHIFHVSGALKDTAVYNAMIAALQLAAQRKLFYETDTQSVTTFDSSRDVTSEQLFEFAQTIYAEGLADGKLQQFAYSASFTARQREGVEGASVEPFKNHSKNRDSRRSKVDSAAPAVSPIETLKQSYLMLEDNSVIRKNPQIEDAAKKDLEEHSPQGSLVEKRSEHKSVAMQRKSIATPTTQTVTSTSTSPLDSPNTASMKMTMTSPLSRAGAPRVLDLHRCPLLVAKTAVDYELKQIHDMLSSPQHDVPPVDSDAALSSSGEIAGYVTTISRRYSRLNRGQSSTALNEIGSRETAASPVRTVSEGSSINRRERRSDRGNRPSKKTSSLLTDGAVVDRSDSPHPPPQLDLAVEALIENKSAEEETGTRTQSAVRFLECSQDLHIITGRGRHVNSSGTRGVLRSAMKDYLLENYDIAAHSMPGNDGCLVISRRSIDAWIRRVSALQFIV